jgi:hypothetical protein
VRVGAQEEFWRSTAVISVAFAAGIASWIAISAISGEPEAWDAYPVYDRAMIAVSFGLGLALGRGPWHIGLSLGGAHFLSVIVLVPCPIGPLIGAGLYGAALVGLFWGIVAYVGILVRRGVCRVFK